MSRTKIWRLSAILTVAALVAVACGGGATQAPPAAATQAPAAATQAPAAATEAPESVGGFQVPDVEDGKFNVAMVLIGPHDDGGWSQAHYEGLLDTEASVPNVHVAYIENVPE